MCFVKSSKPAPTVQEPEIDRKQADASLTKNSQISNTNRGYGQNIKTSAYGLSDMAKTERNTLLGE